MASVAGDVWNRLFLGTTAFSIEKGWKSDNCVKRQAFQPKMVANGKVNADRTRLKHSYVALGGSQH